MHLAHAATTTPTRSADDYTTQRRYADKLWPDFIVFGKVNGEKATGMVFGPTLYDIFWDPSCDLTLDSCTMTRFNQKS